MLSRSFNAYGRNAAVFIILAGIADTPLFAWEYGGRFSAPLVASPLEPPAGVRVIDAIDKIFFNEINECDTSGVGDASPVRNPVRQSFRFSVVATPAPGCVQLLFSSALTNTVLICPFELPVTASCRFSTTPPHRSSTAWPREPTPRSRSTAARSRSAASWPLPPTTTMC